MIGAAEDPEKVLDQAIVDMQNDLVKMKQSVAQAIASQKRVKQQADQADAEADKWHKRAQLALEQGDEDLARQALKRKKSYVETATSLNTQIDNQSSQVEAMKQNLVALEGKISEARTKKDMLKARANAAKANEQLQDTMGQLNTDSSMAAFQRMEEKIMMMEAKTQAAAEIAGSDLESQFAQLESGDVDDELAAMKAQMLEGSAADQGQLPAGEESVEPTDSEIDAELEDLKAQIDQL
jgi:phage shock protein A